MFKVGDKVHVIEKRWLPTWGGEMPVINVWPSGNICCEHPVMGEGAFSPHELVGNLAANANAQGFVFRRGDVVRAIKDFHRQFTIGKEYVIREQAVDWCSIVADDMGTENGAGGQNFVFVRPGDPSLNSQIPTVPMMATIPPHSCLDAENRKTYDSGWSRYDYCKVCDKKIKD